MPATGRCRLEIDDSTASSLSPCTRPASTAARHVPPGHHYPPTSRSSRPQPQPRRVDSARADAAHPTPCRLTEVECQRRPRCASDAAHLRRRGGTQRRRRTRRGTRLLPSPSHSSADRRTRRRPPRVGPRAPCDQCTHTHPAHDDAHVRRRIRRGILQCAAIQRHDPRDLRPDADAAPRAPRQQRGCGNSRR